MPSVRPRLSPWTTSPSTMNGPPRKSLAASTSPAATSPRMWLEDTVSPATSTSGTTRVSNSLVRAQELGVALGALAEAEVLADRHVAGAELADQHLLDEVLVVLLAERAVERDHDQLLDPEPGDQVALEVERLQQLGQRVRGDHRQRVRVEGEHRVHAADHLAVAEVDAVERADGDLARAVERPRVG